MELLLVNGNFARVTHVFKNSGDVDVMSNYRPICVIGHITKMVGQLVRSQLVRYLEEHHFITPDQSAYLKGHSTQTSLHRVIDDWLNNINEDKITGVCLLDISKCFDTINHSILLQKLSMHGIKYQELKCFSSYLDNQKQAVLCHNELSCFVDVICGVLGQFLFLLFINDVSQFTTDGCLTNLCADDSMIYASGDDILQVQQKLQQCVKNISSWYKINRLNINIYKTKAMLIGSKSQLKSLNVDDFILSYDDTTRTSWEFQISRHVYKLWYLMGFPLLAPLSEYVLPYIITKKIASYISN